LKVNCSYSLTFFAAFALASKLYEPLGAGAIYLRLIISAVTDQRFVATSPPGRLQSITENY